MVGGNHEVTLDICFSIDVLSKCLLAIPSKTSGDMKSIHFTKTKWARLMYLLQSLFLTLKEELLI